MLRSHFCCREITKSLSTFKAPPNFHKSRRISSRTANYLIRFVLMSCKKREMPRNGSFSALRQLRYRRRKTNIPRALNSLTDDSPLECLFKEIDSVNYFRLFFRTNRQFVLIFRPSIGLFSALIRFCCKTDFRCSWQRVAVSEYLSGVTACLVR